MNMSHSSAKPSLSWKNHATFCQFIICLMLAGMTFAVFWPVGHLGFSIYDDQEYVVQNPHVQASINADSIGWAFTTTDTGNWHPITWLSHMVDCLLFGLKAGGHHWMNLGFHTANVVLLFLVLNLMTRSRADKNDEAAPPQTEGMWCSALVAALFALHPLRVESVAWISERKDVLSAFFMMLTLWAWVRYAQKPETGSRTSTLPASGYYWLALFFFALGLMSKPMLVTLPIILLLLDFWPLRRFAIHDFRSAIWKRLVFEKLPFFLLVAASCIITFQAQSAGGSVVSLSGLPLGWRMENSLVSYAAYLEKIIWPENLALLYPIGQIPAWEVFGSGALLAGLSVIFLWRSRRQPYLTVGWFWFLIMLVPVIGLVQVGKEAMADRYTYLPSIGLFIMLAWGMAGIAAKSKPWRTIMILVAAGTVLACLPETRRQLNFWQDDVKLFGHSIAVTPEDNYEGYLFLGNALVEAGNLDAAVQSYQSSLRIDPNETTHLEQAHYNLGCALSRQKKFSEAGVHFDEALQLDENNVQAHVGLGHALVAQKKYAEAEGEFSSALQLSPDDAAIRKDLAFATLMIESKTALTNFYESLKVKPTPDAHVGIATIQIMQGNFQDAVEHYRAALQLQPDASDVLNNLAWLLTTCPDAHVRNGAQAVKYAERACELTHYDLARAVGTLAAAYAEAGRFDDAISTAQKACVLAEQSGEQDLLQKNQELLKLYRARQPFHESLNH